MDRCTFCTLFSQPVYLCACVCVSVINVAGLLKPADTGTLLPALNYLYCFLSFSPSHGTDRGDWHPPAHPHHPTTSHSFSLARLGFAPSERSRADQAGRRSAAAFSPPASESHRAIKSHLGD